MTDDLFDGIRTVTKDGEELYSVVDLLAKLLNLSQDEAEAYWERMKEEQPDLVKYCHSVDM